MKAALLRYLPLLLLALAWEASARSGVVSTLALPPLSAVAAAWIELVKDGELITNGVASLWRAGAGLFLAIDRKELDGRFVGLSAVSSSKPDWLRDNSNMRALMQFARQTRHPNYPYAPTARELATNDRARALIEIAEMPYLLSRPFVAPPGVPAERAKALEAAFLAANDDLDYLTEAKRLQLDVSPIDGATVLSILDRIAQAPQEVLDEMRQVKGGSKK